MDTKALRQKILDLAIHGKLVPQAPNDEPASVLLERIKAEKERLIKEGKIRRSKKSAKTSDTPHYENVLPNGWCFSTLGEVFTLQAGKNITAKDIKDTATELHPYKCYGGNGVRGFVALYNREGNFPIIGRQGALCGNINIAKEKFYATEHAVVVERYCDVDLMWAYYMLTALNLNQYATATAQPGLSVTVINDVCISLPPRKEQERISKEIGHWFALLDQIEQGKADLQTTIKLTKSKILDLAIHGKLVPQDPNDEPAIELLKRMNPDFTPCDNGHYPQLPNGWAIIKVGDAAIYVNGRAFKPEEWNNKGLPIIRIQNLNDAAAHYNYSCDVYEDKYLIHKGDLLFAWAASLGTYIWNGNEAWLNQHIFKVIPYPFMDKKFLYYAFKSMISDFITQSHGSGMVHITKKQFENITLLLPPLDEQKRIVQTLERYYKQIDAIMENL